MSRVRAELRGLRRRMAERGVESDVWDAVQLARHEARPYTLDYAERLLEDFAELHGDRACGEDPAIVAGLGRFRGRTVAVVGHQKGRDIKERAFRNFGMARPEGYNKAIRVFALADRLGFPVDHASSTPRARTPARAPSERGQAGAIARTMLQMMRLRVPSVAVVIGEGGSGGALAIARRRPGPDARARDLLGDLARGLRRHPVARRRPGAQGRGGLQADRPLSATSSA